ncbi:uncharacterized protein LOC111919854 [Lactuca sativa]|uniref:uncharacterized protein LOC111919854 n=1 Tax=Lactuca sativa TaxID=4236 RepID=UPI000CD92B04|nr:uncharacterized protein LOC111919854 [Lactuca sativa]
MQAALDEVEKPAKRGKKANPKKDTTEGPSSKSTKSKKRKGETEKNDELFGDKEEEEKHEVSPRGNTLPRSPTPEDVVNDSIPTPPPSPPKSTVQDSPPPPPPPPPTSQPSYTIDPPPPVSSTPITTAPVPPPIFSQATFTTKPTITSTNDSSVKVNTSDVGVKTEDPPKVTIEPISPPPSSESNLVLGGAEFEFDSTYYSPYRIPSEEDESALATKQQIDSVNEKLDALIRSSKKCNDVVMKAFLDTALHQYHESIDKCTVALDDSTSLCKNTTTDVKNLIHDSKVFLDSLKGHAETNAAKVNALVASLSQSLQGEQAKFETLRSDVFTDKKTFLASVDSRLDKLNADFQKVEIARAEREILLLKTERVVFRSCAGDVLTQLHNVIQAHDPIFTLTIRNHLTSKLLQAIELLREMKGVSERMATPQQGGEGTVMIPPLVKPKVTVKTEPKDNLASGSGNKEKKKHVIGEDNDSEEDQETISEILKRKKRDQEIDENLRVAKEEEEIRG